MKPATALPWDGLYYCTAYGIVGRTANVAYAVHACNAYPELVRFVCAARDYGEGVDLQGMAIDILAKLGE